MTINYTKADVKPISYESEEIRDVVLYFANHAEIYGVDPSKFTLMGYSAGAYSFFPYSPTLIPATCAS